MNQKKRSALSPMDELTTRRRKNSKSYLDEFLADPANRRVFEEEEAAALVEEIGPPSPTERKVS